MWSPLHTRRLACTLSRTLRLTRLCRPAPPIFFSPFVASHTTSTEKPITPTDSTVVADPKWAETSFSARVFSTLQLSEFSEQELQAAFDRADVNHDDILDKEELRGLIQNVKSHQLSQQQIDDFTDCLWDYEMEGVDAQTQQAANGGEHNQNQKQKQNQNQNQNGNAPAATGVIGITEPQFKERTRALASALDPRVKSIAAMFAFSGISIGVIMPVMPQLVEQLSISSSQYGMIVGAFAATKMVCNIPAASLVDKFGRKNILTGSMIIIGVSLAGIGAATQFQDIAMCRACTGIGVAGFMTAATMYLTDISTPLNRARTLAPPMTAFSAGAAIGPAIGGIMADSVGIPLTFFFVGASFGCLSMANQMFMPESRSPLPSSPPSKKTAETETETSVIHLWRKLLQDDRILNMTILNGGYWFVLAGSQMTLMPLMLVGEQFHLSASSIGGVFAAASIVSVVCTPLAAKLLDSIGQIKAVVPACFAIGACMVAVPMADHELVTFLALFYAWTTAGTLLAAGPTAYVSNITSAEDRGQALAMLRTGGDVGMLSGAVMSGVMAGMLSSEPYAILLNGAGFVVLTGFSGMRLWLRDKDMSVREK